MTSLEEIFARLQHSEETTRSHYNPFANLIETSSNLRNKPILDGAFKVPQLDEEIYKQACNDVIKKFPESANVNLENDATCIRVVKEVSNSQQAEPEINLIEEKRISDDKLIQASSLKGGMKTSDQSMKYEAKPLTASNKLKNFHRQPQPKKVSNTNEPRPSHSRDLLKFDKSDCKFDRKPTTKKSSKPPAQRTTKLNDGTASTNAVVNPIDYHSQLSKMLFYILMHWEESGLEKTDDEFIDLVKIMELPLIVRKKCSVEDIKRIVLNQNDINYGWFKLLMDNNKKFKIKVNTENHSQKRKRDTSSKTAQRNALMHVLHNSELLNIPKTETGFYDVFDVLKEPSIVEKSIKTEDIERILDDPIDYLYGKFIFIRYESGRCRIKENPTFTKGYRKVKVKFTNGNFTERELAIAKSISYLLRHNSERLIMSDEGFVDLNDLLKHPKIAKLGCTFEDMKKLLTMDIYARYVMVEYESNLYKIKAIHGHSIRRILDWNFANWREVTEVPVIVHKCTYPTWFILRKNGFEKTKRATFNGIDPNNIDFVHVREIDIFLDVEQARRDGAKFYIVPENKIIITEGLESGLGTKYFIKVVDVATGDFIKFR